MHRARRAAIFPFLLLSGCDASPASNGPQEGSAESDASLTGDASTAYWKCADDRTGCLCVLFEPGTCFGSCEVFGADVPYCRPYDLCHVLDNSQCVCTFADRGGAEPEGRRVSSCPQDDEGSGVSHEQCAARGAPCALSDLSSANVGDCCDGLVCDLDGTEGLRCREGTASDEAAELACRRGSSRQPSSALLSTSDVVTNLGTIPVAAVGYSAVALGADGRLARVTLHLYRDYNLGCDVAITAVADGADPHELSITAVNVRGLPCRLASTEAFWLDDPSILDGTLSLSPQLYCDTSGNALCVHGTFSIAIAGRIPAQDGSDELSFLSPIGIEGTLCESSFFGDSWGSIRLPRNILHYDDLTLARSQRARRDDAW